MGVLNTNIFNIINTYSIVILYCGFKTIILSNKSSAFLLGYPIVLDTFYFGLFGSVSMKDKAFSFVVNAFNSSSEGFPNISKNNLIICI